MVLLQWSFGLRDSILHVQLYKYWLKKGFYDRRSAHKKTDPSIVLWLPQQLVFLFGVPVKIHLKKALYTDLSNTVVDKRSEVKSSAVSAFFGVC